MNDIDPAAVPYDHEAERQVVGACLLDEAALRALGDQLGPKDFHYRPHWLIVSAAAEMQSRGQPVSVATVSRSLGDQKLQGGNSALEECGGRQYLVRCIEGADTSQWEFWAERIGKKRDERLLLDFSMRARKAALSSPEDFSRELAKLEEELLHISGADAGGGTVSIAEAADGLAERMDRFLNDPDALIGIPTGWDVFDRYLDGLQLGGVTIVYAPTSRYKSLFVQNIGWAMARQGYPGLWFTTEMPRVVVQERLLQLETGLNFKWHRRARTLTDHRDRIRRGQRLLTGYPIFFNDNDVDVGMLRSEVLRQKRWNNIQYVIVDLLDHVSTSLFKDDSVSQQAAIMKKMKQIAKAADVHIILTTHIAKSEKALRTRADLDVEDMKGSSAKYQDVDAAISLMCVRWDFESMDWKGLDRREIETAIRRDRKLYILASITKNRHGELGRLVFEMDWDMGGRFIPQDRAEYAQLRLDGALEKQLEEEAEALADDVATCTDEDVTAA